MSVSNEVSIFTEMSTLANRHNAVNLSQGFPDFPPDLRLTDFLKVASDENVHQYMSSAGYLPLRQNIANSVNGIYSRKVNPDKEVLITAGATQGIFVSIQSLIKSGDEVIILNPAYDCYETPVLLVGGIPIHINLSEDFSPDWNVIFNAAGNKTKMIIINNPHNPSGRIWKEADFLKLEEFSEKFPNIIILSDEVYEHITFELKHNSINSREKLRSRSVIISSFGKSFHITGWKVGYLIASEPLMKIIKNIHQYLVFSVNSVAQFAINSYHEVVSFSDLKTLYLQKRNSFTELIKDTKFTLLPCEGSYFQIASYSEISNESDISFTKRLVTDYGVATIPLSPFYKSNKDQKLIRFCFAKQESTLLAAAAKLLKL